MSYVRAVSVRIWPCVYMNTLVKDLYAISCFIRYKYGIKEPDISVETYRDLQF